MRRKFIAVLMAVCVGMTGIPAQAETIGTAASTETTQTTETAETTEATEATETTEAREAIETTEATEATESIGQTGSTENISDTKTLAMDPKKVKSAGTPVDIQVTDANLENAAVLQHFKNMGVNFEMSFTSDEMWQSNGNWMDHTYANSGIRMVRWGYDAWVFDWQDEIPLNTNYQGGMNTKNDLGSRGFREFVKFAKRNNIIPFVHIPFESWNHKNGSTIEEKKQDKTYQQVLNLAANMATYMKEQGIEQAYFDLGNEPAQAPSCPYGTFSAQEYGSAFPDFYEVIKRADANYKLVMQIESSSQYNQLKQYAKNADGSFCFDAVDKHVYNNSGVGWDGYYARTNDDVFKADITVDEGIEKIMGECNVPWPNFPTYSTNLGAAICLVNGFAKLAQDDDYSSVIMWPSQWSSNDTMYNAFNPSGKSFGWFDQDGWYDSKATNRLTGPATAEMMVQKFVLANKVDAASDNAKVRTFAFTNDDKSEMNIFVINKEKSDMTFNLSVPQKFNKVKAVMMSGDKDETTGSAQADQTPDYRGHISNEDVISGAYSDVVTAGECAIVYTFYTDDSAQAPAAFAAVAPANGTSDVSTAVNFKWSASAEADDYQFILSKNQDMSAPVIETTTMGQTNYQLSSDIDHSTAYYWQVKAVNKSGETAMDQGTLSFNTTRARHFVDNNDSSITYEGSWDAEQSYLGAFGRKDHGTGTAGSKMTIRFTGTQAILYGIKDNWIRKISLKVDGKEAQTIDLYESRGVMQYDINDPAHYSRGSGETEANKKKRLTSVRPTQQVIYDTGKISDADMEHTIQIEVLDEYNPKEDTEADGAWRGFDFDYYEIIQAGETPLKTCADMPKLTTDLPQQKAIVKGRTMELSAAASVEDGGTLSYEWYKDGVLLAGETGSTLTVTDFDESKDGSYQFRVTNSINDSVTRTTTSSIAECTASDPVPALGVTVNPKTLTLKIGEKQTLSATVNPADTTDSVVWSSANPQVAQINATTGEVTAAAKGTAVITAAAGSISDTCTVTVTEESSNVKPPEDTETQPPKDTETQPPKDTETQPPKNTETPNEIAVTEVKLDKDKAILLKGNTLALTAIVSPVNAANQTLTWSASDPKIAAVDDKGLVTAAAKGKTAITVTSANGKTAVCEITVPEVTFNAAKTVLQTGKSSTALKIASKYPSSDTVSSYSSSNKKILTADKKGKITGKKTGTAVITVTMKSGATAKCTVKVQKNKVTTNGLSLNKKSMSLVKGKKASLTVTRNPITATEKIKWSTSNKKVAAVDSKGRITAKGKGTAVITAKSSNGKKATCKITVPQVSLKKTSAVISVGKTTTIQLESVYPKSDKVKSYQSSDVKTATVDNKGKVTGVQKGTAKIKVIMKSGAVASFTVKVK